MTRATLPTAAGTKGYSSSPSLVMGPGGSGGCEYDGICGERFDFGWTFEYFGGGGGAGGSVAYSTLETVIVVGQSIKSPCSITIDHVTTNLDTCDFSSLQRVPPDDVRAPLYNLTPKGQAELQDMVAQLTGVKVQKCVVANTVNKEADAASSYQAATQAAQSQLSGLTVKKGYRVDVKYQDGSVFTFGVVIPNPMLSDGKFHLVTPVERRTGDPSPCVPQG